jgi:RNA polymerase sigma factor (sigma-70 family)
VEHVGSESLFRAHYAGLVRLAIVFGMSRSEAEEAVQDSFVAFARTASDVTPGSELAYLRRSTINASLGRHRRARRSNVRPLEPRDEWISERDANESSGERSAVRAAVWALPAQQRACVVLRYYEGLTEAETAEVLEVSVGTVKTHVSRARATLRTKLEDSDDVG